MKNVKRLNVLLVEEDKMKSEDLRKFIRANAKVDELVIEALNEADNVINEIETNDIVPQLIFLSEPSLNKIKFANEIKSRIDHIKRIKPDSEVVVITSPYKIETALDTFRSGVFDVILKDENVSRNVVNSIHRYLKGREEKPLELVKQRESITSI